MDGQLQKALESWHEHLPVVYEAEELYHNCIASEKHLFSNLFLAQDGKSIAEREAKAYASKEWKHFADGLAEATVRRNASKRQLDLKIKQYEAVYLSAKLEAEAIRRHP